MVCVVVRLTVGGVVLVVGVVVLCVLLGVVVFVVDVAAVVVVVVVVGAVLVAVVVGVVVVTVVVWACFLHVRRAAEERRWLAIARDRASGEELRHRVESDDDRESD